MNVNREKNNIGVIKKKTNMPLLGRTEQSAREKSQIRK